MLRIERRRLWIFSSVALVICVFGMIFSAQMMSVPLQAQQIFVTSTPRPPDLLNNTPPQNALLSQYALRLWQQNTLIDLLVRQIERLATGEDMSPEAVRFTQYELNQRFPNAPTDATQRERILNAMLNAPRGSVDMRGIVRPYIIDQLSENRVSATSFQELTINGFMVETQPINLDGTETGDIYAHVRYPANASAPNDILYDDHLLILGAEDGGYNLPAYAVNLPAAPFDTVSSISLWRLADLTGDGRTEMGLLIDRGEINQRLEVYGWRANQVNSLILPGERILVGESITRIDNSSTIQVEQYRLDSSRWQCYSTLTIDWRWDANFYRPSTDLNAAYTNTDTIGCDLLEAEPVFVNPGEMGINLVSGMIDATDDPAERGFDRANVALAMMYLLNDQRDDAINQIEEMLAFTDGNKWLQGQVETFVNNSIGDDVSALNVCAALLLNNPDGACNMDQMLTLLFIENPIVRDLGVEEQLEALDLPIAEILTVSEVGRLDRTVVNFNLTGASWWAFAPTDPTFYVPEPVDPPNGVEAIVFPMGLITPPDSAYALLFVQRDPSAALTVLDNEERNNPDTPLSVEARYFRAFCLDMLSDRLNARQGYFDLWTEFPTTHWGQLAGAHLEQRG
ncbi:MAG: tetratricopeptide repeat protein [Aggregatilineales bacterium]